MENSMQSMSTINPAVTENMECLIIKVCAPTINQIMGVSLDHNVSLRFASNYFEHFR